MSSIQYKIIFTCEKEKYVIHNQGEKNSKEGDTQISQMLELADKSFKITIVNM